MPDLAFRSQSATVLADTTIETYNLPVGFPIEGRGRTLKGTDVRISVLTIPSAAVFAVLMTSWTEAAVIVTLAPNSRIQQDDPLTRHPDLLDSPQARARRITAYGNENRATTCSASGMAGLEEYVPPDRLNESAFGSTASEEFSNFFDDRPAWSIYIWSVGKYRLALPEEAPHTLQTAHIDAATARQGSLQARLFTTNTSVIRPPGSESILPDPRSPCSRAVGFWLDGHPVILIAEYRDTIDYFAPLPGRLLPVILFYALACIATAYSSHRREPVQPPMLVAMS